MTDKLPSGSTDPSESDADNNAEEAVPSAESTQSTPTSDSSKSELFGPSDDELQKELHKYAKALRQEFERAEHPDDRASENVEKFTRDFFKKNLASACAQIVWLSANSTSDSVRLQACKTIVHEALSASKADGDPVKEILQSLGAMQVGESEALDADV